MSDIGYRVTALETAEEVLRARLRQQEATGGLGLAALSSLRYEPSRPPADAYRAWGERFFPVAPSRPTPVLSYRAIVSVTEIPAVLKDRTEKAIQGTIARSGEVLLLAFDPDEESRAG